MTELPTPHDHAEQTALFRWGLIGKLCSADRSRGALRAELRSLSRERVRPPGSQTTRSFSVPTLERWLYAARRGGFEALRPKARSDKGFAQALTAEQSTLLLDIRAEHPDASTALILATLQAQGQLDKGTLSEPTLRRFYDQHGQSPRKRPQGGKARMRWEAERPMALWHGDVCHLPGVQIGGETVTVRVHGLLDDASRYVVALDAMLQERELDMMHVLSGALLRQGLPGVLYLDNGATYRGKALEVVCARLDIKLLHPGPYDPQARGKMERFWRTMRSRCTDHLGALSGLPELQQRLDRFLSLHYQRAPHGGLLGRTPADRFAERGEVDRPAPAKLAEAMTVQESRRVSGDNVVSLDGHRYQLDQGFLAGKVVTVHRPLLGDDKPWVEHERKRLLLHPADPVRNGKTRRAALPTAAPRKPSGVRFDPTAPAEESDDELFLSHPLQPERSALYQGTPGRRVVAAAFQAGARRPDRRGHRSARAGPADRRAGSGQNVCAACPAAAPRAAIVSIDVLL